MNSKSETGRPVPRLEPGLGKARSFLIPDRALPTRQRIQERAFELYCERGRQDGRDWEDWLSAERELLSRFFREER
jgi:hypothetical protein